jgi:hypothetical protein
MTHNSLVHFPIPSCETTLSFRVLRERVDPTAVSRTTFGHVAEVFMVENGGRCWERDVQPQVHRAADEEAVEVGNREQVLGSDGNLFDPVWVRRQHN